MDIISDLLIKLSVWLLPHLKLICIAKVSTLLVIYGDTLQNWLKKNISAMNRIFRTLIFVAFCTFAYGGLLGFVAPLLGQCLAKIPLLFLSPSILASFIVIGILAERRRYI